MGKRMIGGHALGMLIVVKRKIVMNAWTAQYYDSTCWLQAILSRKN
ncbi:hypothetical protein GbCGDNIH2_5034 [Granulibacter bethesdensis]|uniref:Uncharacterized protein n=2 Tax=Granulibacter bethesdensis TaxID=364410 RepID=A0A286M2Y4_GRABC|nr:hypothetical protein GbCGDNIH3_5034 [Granulibacter bethesdensis]AHJ65142.1 hypothetical protein GbCGDNIH4_5034 [Granulibacter bethesdensis CGDNIH4]ASV62383.1 hypothetical protein GbCGDNIH1_5034 [Granulibacter bethesdensis CGDNIH1]AHJ67763.1 hypothetical protein GbCGDNIH2_5034 [Granulibacter bethesdensis]APH51423.1 hypothetical protein GbCGDNIH5_5034 [Granulibacter bethesdensis]